MVMRRIWRGPAQVELVASLSGQQWQVARIPAHGEEERWGSDCHGLMNALRLAWGRARRLWGEPPPKEDEDGLWRQWRAARGLPKDSGWNARRASKARSLDAPHRDVTDN